MNYSRTIYFNCPPNSGTWVHDEQHDDQITEKTHERIKKLNELKKLTAFAQRSGEWYEQRNGMMTASLIPTALNMNEYEPQYMSIVGKLKNIPFTGKKACFWGKKYEDIAANIYKYRMNVSIGNYGCIPHPCGFLGASPDGIIDEYKLDGKTKTELVGRMLEIKCVVSRKINMTSNNITEIVPEHYYPQVQIQLQCCGLSECDFWQCNIKEYSSKCEFVNDTHPSEPFRSKTTGFEKGVIIQILPLSGLIKGDMRDIQMDEYRWDNAEWIYPENIEMTPDDCDKWVCDVCTQFHENPMHNDYVIDRVIYWKLIESRCVTIIRDDEWFGKHFPTLENVWNYILTLRSNDKRKKTFLNYVDYASKKFTKKIANKNIMMIAKALHDATYNGTNDNICSEVTKLIEKNIPKKCAFTDEL